MWALAIPLGLVAGWCRWMLVVIGWAMVSLYFFHSLVSFTPVSVTCRSWANCFSSGLASVVDSWGVSTASNSWSLPIGSCNAGPVFPFFSFSCSSMLSFQFEWMSAVCVCMLLASLLTCYSNTVALQWWPVFLDTCIFFTLLLFSFTRSLLSLHVTCPLSEELNLKRERRVTLSLTNWLR